MPAVEDEDDDPPAANAERPMYDNVDPELAVVEGAESDDDDDADDADDADEPRPDRDGCKNAVTWEPKVVRVAVLLGKPMPNGTGECDGDGRGEAWGVG